MNEQFEYRVSDSMEVPLRGQLLRLKLASGDPDPKAIAAGRKVKVRAPDGRERVVQILDHAISGGNVTRKRLQLTRELDVVVPFDDSRIDDDVIGIGWSVFGPVSN